MPDKQASALNAVVFYAPGDIALLDDFKNHLSTLVDQGIINYWDNQKINAGKNKEQEIKLHLDAASLIFLLISSNFFALPDCRAQMEQALKRQPSAEVIPILLRPCDWEHSLVKDLQILPRNEKAITSWASRDDAFQEVIRGIYQIIDNFNSQNVPDEQVDEHSAQTTNSTPSAQTTNPAEYHSLFISYSSKDDVLATRLHTDLEAHGVRCWFAPKDIRIGDKIRQRIDDAIHVQDKLLLLLSHNSLASTWVANEVEAAFEKEDREKRNVLFPIRLDNAIIQTPEAWAATLRRTRHIGDFTNWTNEHAYQAAFDRLLRDLKQN